MYFFSPEEISDITVESGIKKASQSIFDLLLSSLLAGAYIAMAGAASTIVAHDAPEFLGYGLARFITGSVFALGLLLVVICGSNLFTGNNLLVVAYLNSKITLQRMIRNWCWVFLGNFIGAILVAYIIFKTNLWTTNDYQVGVTALKTAYSKVTLTFSEAFTRGIMCNWLVCLAVWGMTAAKDIAGKILICYFPIMAFVACGFEHIIANMYYIPLGLFLKGQDTVVNAAGLHSPIANLNWASMISNNFFPVLLGNLVGGTFFVGVLYWALYQRKKLH